LTVFDRALRDTGEPFPTRDRRAATVTTIPAAFDWSHALGLGLFVVIGLGVPTLIYSRARLRDA